MEEDIIVVNKKRKGLFLLESNDSRILYYWSFIIFAIFIVDIFFTPLSIVWPENLSKFLPIFKLCNAVWLMNILIRCITIRQGQDVIDNKTVFFSYLKSTFTIDVLATIPIILANND